MANQMQIFAVKEFASFSAVESVQSPAVIKVIGTGGGGSNAVNCMIESGFTGVIYRG